MLISDVNRRNKTAESGTPEEKYLKYRTTEGNRLTLQVN